MPLSFAVFFEPRHRHQWLKTEAYVPTRDTVKMEMAMMTEMVVGMGMRMVMVTEMVIVVAMLMEMEMEMATEMVMVIWIMVERGLTTIPGRVASLIQMVPCADKQDLLGQFVAIPEVNKEIVPVMAIVMVMAMEMVMVTVYLVLDCFREEANPCSCIV